MGPREDNLDDKTLQRSEFESVASMSNTNRKSYIGNKKRPVVCYMCTKHYGLDFEEIQWKF